MKILIRALPALLFLLLSACVGPLVNHETARTVGDNNHELLGGGGQAGYIIKYNYGITENLDFGVHWESLSLGVRMKYAFINVKEGFSLAAAAGTGASIGGQHYYADVVGSYRTTKKWEPYGMVRVVHVELDPVELRDQNTGGWSFTIPGTSFDYGQFTGGTRFWFNENWLMSLEASSLFAITSGFKTNNNFFVGAAFGYRWL